MSLEEASAIQALRIEIVGPTMATFIAQSSRPNSEMKGASPARYPPRRRSSLTRSIAGAVLNFPGPELRRTRVALMAGAGAERGVWSGLAGRGVRATPRGGCGAAGGGLLIRAFISTRHTRLILATQFRHKPCFSRVQSRGIVRLRAINVLAAGGG